MVRQHHRRDVWLIGGLIGLAVMSSDLASGSVPVVTPSAASRRPAPYIGSKPGPAAMERPLSNQSGDPKRGETIVVDSKKGNCLICHVVPIAGVPAAAFGDLGPSLQGV
jgi:sulfur-oxidizing protein SoxX